MECPQCRKPLREGSRFCTGCGLATGEMNVATEKVIPRDTGEDEGRRR